jgi:hypothetical protein
MMNANAHYETRAPAVDVLCGKLFLISTALQLSIHAAFVILIIIFKKYLYPLFTDICKSDERAEILKFCLIKKFPGGDIMVPLITDYSANFPCRDAAS